MVYSLCFIVRFSAHSSSLPDIPRFRQNQVRNVGYKDLGQSLPYTRDYYSIFQLVMQYRLNDTTQAGSPQVSGNTIVPSKALRSCSAGGCELITPEPLCSASATKCKAHSIFSGLGESHECTRVLVSKKY
jgi:hypothetical protein